MRMKEQLITDTCVENMVIYIKYMMEIEMTREEILKVAKPILFNTEMVRAIIKGTGVNFKYYKTCTRRILKDNKPAYKVGDILYVRETWAAWSRTIGGMPTIHYKADGELLPGVKWHPSIHMPKEAAKLFLQVTAVRKEHLQDMDGFDALYEGVNTLVHPQASYFHANQLKAFAKLWDSTIKKKDLDKYGWDANPWVWVYEFERVEV